MYDENASVKAYLKSLGIACLWVAGFVAASQAVTSVLDKAFGPEDL